MYTWTKTYAVNAPVSDETKVGDTIEVGDRNGGSKQKVLSVTVRKNKSGSEYKTLLLEAV